MGTMTQFDDLIRMQAAVQDRSILSLFDTADRAQTFSAQTGDMLFDFSKTNLDRDTMDALLALVDAADVPARRDAMFAGEKINETEDRAVLHTALRNLDGGAVMVDGADVMPGVHDTLDRMRGFADQIRSSDITDVVNIGTTWLAADAQQMGINREAKLLMLTHAFESWLVHRVRDLPVAAYV